MHVGGERVSYGKTDDYDWQVLEGHGEDALGNASIDFGHCAAVVVRAPLKSTI